METGKTSKYITYAIGEIILVVIGILIALYINNWNIENKNLVKEQVILSQLHEDYSDNLNQLEEKIQMRSKLIQSSINVLKQIDTSDILQESLLMPELLNIVKDPTFDPIENNIINSGDIKLIQNDSLKRLLSRWTSDVKQVQQLELEWQKMRTDIFISFLIESEIARNFHHATWKEAKAPIELLDNTLESKLDIGLSKFSNNINKSKTKQKLESVVSSAISPNQVANLQSIALRNRIYKILEIINEDLKEK